MGHPENTEIERGRKTEAEILKLWTVPKWPPYREIGLSHPYHISHEVSTRLDGTSLKPRTGPT